MKNVLLVCFLLGTNVSMVGQGFLVFNHRISSAGNPVRTLAGDALVGTNYLAQLWAGPTEANLRPVEFDTVGNSAVYPFPPLAAPDAVQGFALTHNATVVIENVAPGQVAWVQLRVWNTSDGAFPTWDHAVLYGTEFGISFPAQPTERLGGLTGEGDPILPPIPPPTLPPIPGFNLDPSILGEDRSFLFSPQTLSLSWSDSGLNLRWEVGYLESADSPLGPWVREENITSPLEIETVEASKFYRLSMPQ